MIAYLLHIANSYANAVDEKRFYAMKYRILRRYGQPDGHDVQHIPGKKCFGCGGTGIFEHTYSGDRDYCWKCGGSKWFKLPVWIVLNRYRLGRFTFHIPGERSHQEPVPNTTRIEGYVTHPDYGYRAPEWACIVLGLLFDWPLARKGLRDKWNRQKWLMSLQKRCIDCKRHTWYWKTWRCRHCERLLELGRLEEDVPF